MLDCYYMYPSLVTVAGLDYSNLTDFVTVFSTPFINCSPIPIVRDSVVESTEQFFALLSSFDSAVEVASSSQIASVVILDDSGISVVYTSIKIIVYPRLCLWGRDT